MEPFVLQEAASHQLLLSAWMQKDAALTAGFTTRKAGVSLAPYKSFNIGLHVGDDQDSVIHNRRKLAESVGMSFETWVSGEQIHHNNIAIVASGDCGRGSSTMDDAIPGVDGLLTNDHNVLLTSFYADCVPLYFWDKEKGVIGLAHAGWKGTVTAIAYNMIDQMKAIYGSNPDQIYCAIGPAIHTCCYEVNHVVIDRVESLWKQLALPQELLESIFNRKKEGYAHINLKEINRQIMIKAGIMPSRIEISERCTGCQSDLFFSHRKENGKTGRMASWIGLRKEG